MSHVLFFNIPNNIIKIAIASTSVYKDYIKVNPLTTDATALKWNTKLYDRTFNNRELQS